MQDEYDEDDVPDLGGAFNPFSRKLCKICGWRGGHGLDCPILQGLEDEDGTYRSTASEAERTVDAIVKGRSKQEKDDDVLKKPVIPNEKEIGMLLGKEKSESSGASPGSKGSKTADIKKPDMSQVGQKSISTMEKCKTCKIKIPGADAETYKKEKRCPFGKQGCPFTDMEDLGAGPAEEEKEIKKNFSMVGFADICGDGSVMKKVNVIGEGTAVPKLGSTVIVDYIGKLFPDGLKFDSSIDRGKPFTFVLGEDPVIKGWVDALQTMRKKEKSLFVIQPQKGYGRMGNLSTIPPNAVLQFEIELHSWEEKNQGSSDDNTEGENKDKQDAEVEPGMWEAMVNNVSQAFGIFGK
eukprot:m.31669 g.31669  ORF g.31669 m.31669 type:complete len:351 (+) comp8336_c0_seq2:108-1160(+)